MAAFYNTLQDITVSLEAIEKSIILFDLKDKILSSSLTAGSKGKKEAAISFAKCKQSELIGAFMLIHPALYDAARTYKPLKESLSEIARVDPGISCGLEIIHACVEKMWMRHLDLMRLLTRKIYH